MNLIINYRSWAWSFGLLCTTALFVDRQSELLQGTTANRSGGKTIYVQEAGSGKGHSWETALGDLQTALKMAKKGDRIWVAAGTYRPTDDGDRTVAFELVNEVSLYGGFAGHEASQTERDPQRNRTILSGEIGSDGPEDNSFTIVYAENISQTTIIDGFFITGGHANGSGEDPLRSSCGAAWFNLGASPYISNCTFQKNTAREGGAMFNNTGKGGESSPRIVNCNFIDNVAELDGGAIFNNGDDGKCMPRIEQCYFENNTATYGAVMMNQATNGLTKVTLCQCKFIRNRSLVSSNVIYNHRSNTGICVANTQDCLFEDYQDASTRLNNGISTDFDPRFNRTAQPQRAETADSWCYADEPEFCQLQGRLYTFPAARQICAGKSIPSVEEWLSPLSGYFDDELQQAVGDPTSAYIGIIGEIGTGELKTHELLGGKFNGEQFIDRGIAGYFWTSTPRNEQENYIIYFDARDGMVHKGWANTESGLFCMCYERN